MGNFSILNLVTAVFGLAVSWVLVFSSQHNKLLNRLLGIGFFTMSYRSISIFALQENILPNTFLMGTVSFVYYFIPPILYLYFRKTIRDESSLTVKDSFHFFIPMLAVLLLVYYLFANHSLSGKWAMPAQSIKYGEKGWLPVYIPTSTHVFVIVGMSILYCVASWREVYLNLRMKKGEHPQVSKVRNWVITLLITCSLLLVILFTSAILSWTLGFETRIVNIPNLNIARSVIVNYVFAYAMLNTDLLFGIPKIETVLPDVESIRKKATLPVEPLVVILDEEPVEKIEEIKVVVQKEVIEPIEEVAEGQLFFDAYGWLHLKHSRMRASQPMETDKVQEYIEELNTYMTGHPYTDPDFDMKTISTHLQVPHYHLEYLFRYYNRYSFPEFRNILRIQYVLKEFSRGQHRSHTIEAIGLRAGFSSRSSFFRVFKTVTGKTPKQVVDENKSNPDITLESMLQTLAGPQPHTV